MKSSSHDYKRVEAVLFTLRLSPPPLSPTLSLSLLLFLSALFSYIFLTSIHASVFTYVLASVKRLSSYSIVSRKPEIFSLQLPSMYRMDLGICSIFQLDSSALCHHLSPESLLDGLYLQVEDFSLPFSSGVSHLRLCASKSSYFSDASSNITAGVQYCTLHVLIWACGSMIFHQWVGYSCLSRILASCVDDLPVLEICCWSHKFRVLFWTLF